MHDQRSRCGNGGTRPLSIVLAAIFALAVLACGLLLHDLHRFRISQAALLKADIERAEASAVAVDHLVLALTPDPDSGGNSGNVDAGDDASVPRLQAAMLEHLRDIERMTMRQGGLDEARAAYAEALADLLDAIRRQEAPAWEAATTFDRMKAARLALGIGGHASAH